MRTEQIALSPLAPGASLSLTVHRFGEAGARPLVYVQASLHADEIPGMIAAHHLRERLTALRPRAGSRARSSWCPSANPIGLAQRVLGSHVGRFNLADGINFNRGYPYLVPKAAERIDGKLTGDAEANVRLIREALRAELDAWETGNPADVAEEGPARPRHRGGSACSTCIATPRRWCISTPIPARLKSSQPLWALHRRAGLSAGGGIGRRAVRRGLQPPLGRAGGPLPGSPDPLRLPFHHPGIPGRAGCEPRTGPGRRGARSSIS